MHTIYILYMCIITRRNESVFGYTGWASCIHNMIQQSDISSSLRNTEKITTKLSPWGNMLRHFDVAKWLLVCLYVCAFVCYESSQHNFRVNFTDLLSSKTFQKPRVTDSDNSQHATTDQGRTLSIKPLRPTNNIKTMHHFLPQSNLDEGSRGSQGRSKHQSIASWPS